MGEFRSRDGVSFADFIRDHPFNLKGGGAIVFFGVKIFFTKTMFTTTFLKFVNF